MDNTFITSIMQILISILTVGGIIAVGYLLNKKFGNSKVDKVIDSTTQVVNIIYALLTSSKFGDEETITKIKFIIYETLQMIKGVENVSNEMLIDLGIKNIRKLSLDNNIKLTNEQCEIVKSALVLGIDYIKINK